MLPVPQRTPLRTARLMHLAAPASVTQVAAIGYRHAVDTDSSPGPGTPVADLTSLTQVDAVFVNHLPSIFTFSALPATATIFPACHAPRCLWLKALALGFGLELRHVCLSGENPGTHHLHHLLVLVLLALGTTKTHSTQVISSKG